MKKNIKTAILLCAAFLIISSGCTPFVVRNTPDEPVETSDDPGFSFEIDDKSSDSDETGKSSENSASQSNSDSLSDNDKSSSKAKENSDSLVSEAPPENEEITAISLDIEKSDPQIGQTIKVIVTVTPDQDAEYILRSDDENVVTANEDGTLTAVGEGTCTVTAALKDNASVSDAVQITVYAPKNTDQEQNQDFYVDGILIVNKKYFITADYNPGGLTLECYSAFERLTNAAAEEGISIYALSDFRSYEEQVAIYNDYVMQYGEDGANSLCALPGHSEHQTGLAIDCASYDSGYFPGSPAAAWLDEHCADYGFIIRYPAGHEAATGYSYEPWHIRYIGAKAKQITDSGLSLEEYYDLND